MKRICLVCALLALALLEVSCSGDGRVGESEANVYLVITNASYYFFTGQYISVCEGDDVRLSSISFQSRPRNPNTFFPDDSDDVILNRWEITPMRLDGGTPSPPWVSEVEIYVYGGSFGSVSTPIVYPAEYFLKEPLIYLFPENGGFDPETGETVIRQVFKLEFFGETNSGKKVSVSTTKEFVFACTW